MQEEVRKRFCTACVFSLQLSGRGFEIHAEPTVTQFPHWLGAGSTEAEAWANAADNIRQDDINFPRA